MLSALSVSVGWSDTADAAAAGREAAAMALDKAPEKTFRAALVFASSWFDQNKLIQAVNHKLACAIIGGTTAGEITPTGPATHSCVVVLMQSDFEVFRLGGSVGLAEDPRATAQLLSSKIAMGTVSAQRQGLLIFGEASRTAYGQVLLGLRESLGEELPVTGFLTGDDMRFKQGHQYFNSQAMSRGICAMLLSSPLRWGVGMQHGFSPISKPRRITKAQANRLIEIDRKPAVAVLADYFGNESLLRMRRQGLCRESVAFPMGIQDGPAADWSLRHIVNWSKDGSVECNAEIPEDHWMQLMVGNQGLVLEAAQRAAAEALERVPRPGLVLVFSSYVRRQLLGLEHARREFDVIRKAVPAGVPIAGCYSYGEIDPAAMPAARDKQLVQTGSLAVVCIGGEE